MAVVEYELQTTLALVRVNNPPVNALSRAVREGLLEAIAAANAGACRHGIIVCAGDTFIAGADIAELEGTPQPPHLPDVMSALLDSPVIWVAQLHGNVLGGGLELALACDYRIADPATRLAMPEVSLGLIPGAGGTQRLPRLIGLPLAHEMIATGKAQPADRLLAAGGLDALIARQDEAAQHAFISAQANVKRRVDARDPAGSAADADFIATRRAAANEHKLSYDPERPVLDALDWAITLPADDGLQRERDLHLRLRQSDASVALRHLFFAERNVQSPAVIDGVPPGPSRRIGVVGGGLMGCGIATGCLLAGLPVVLIEQDSDAAEVARARIDDLLQGAQARGKLDADALRHARSQLRCSDDYHDLADVDIAIEAVFEDLGVKQSVFSRLADVVRRDTLLATNTSYLDPGAIAQGIAGPDRILGLHFFSPAHVMRLLEIVHTPATSAQTLATAFAFARQIGKRAVLSGICDGFIGNRCLAAYRRQADYLLADGALPSAVDAAMRAYGFPMGPYELQDLTGLQIAWANRKRTAATRPADERYVGIADRLCEAGRLGQRSGCGWYRYEDGSRTPIVDPDVEALISAYSDEQGITRRPFSDEDIQMRLLAAMANEGARIVEEGIADSDAAVDVVKVLGFGFPRWRGGPMHAASRIGVDTMQAWINTLAEQSPQSWTPARRYSA